MAGGNVIITLIAKTRLYQLTLPERVSGQYWLRDEDDQGAPRPVLSAEGVQGGWSLQSSEHLLLLDEKGAEVSVIRLEPEELRVVSAKECPSGQQVRILVEPSSQGRQLFQKYCVRESCRLSVGRAGDNQIIFDNKYVSGHHAQLIYENCGWTVADTQSSNGTFVNGRRAALEKLKPGDVVYIMGMKILIGSGFFAVNDPDGAVQVNAREIYPFQSQPRETQERIAGAPKEEKFFCSPRFRRSVQKTEIKVDAPPPPQRVEEVPLALMLGPAMTMGVTSLVMGGVAIYNLNAGISTLSSALPTLVMSVSMLCGTMLWPLLTKRHDKKKKNAMEAARQDKYREYLDTIRDQLGQLRDQQTAILRENSPTVQECARRALERDRALWERTAEQEDFLRLRLGTGEQPLAAELRFPEQRFSMEDDGLQRDLARLEEEPKTIQDVPITLSLREDPVSGILGPRERTLEMAKSLILQIAALHSAREVKLVLLVDEAELPAWEYARWLPHIWDDAGATRFLAATEQEVRALSAQLERELAERLETLKAQRSLAKPMYVIVSASSQLAEKAAFLTQAIQAPPEAGFVCLALAESLRDLPKECSRAVELFGDGASIYDKRTLSGEKLTFRPETGTDVDADTVARSLADLKLDSQDETAQMPGMLTFLEMYHVGKVEHLNALTRWKENNPVNTLQAPVGVGTDGELFSLDLHEKFHGPHGLVAGMTGSGKSEFIITYLLSLALNYSPEEVSFILIDYKGGGLAGAFEDAEQGKRLPHLAGTITNLDGAAVKRSLISIQSELRRRQALFNEARRISGEGTIDIYKYQKLHRSGLVAEAVPHLLIVSDEFAELKAQQPEFMEQLISAARIGRSLGVHLILATQKPSGVVDDQIWSNSRFRVCLKVQERADSMDMIKRPDAAAIAETGRFYLQVGFNEYFAMGQSAWSGAPYQPAERPQAKRDDGVMVLDRLGRVLSEARPRPERQAESGCSQVVAIVDYLSALAGEEHLAARRLWLPAIPGKILLEALREKYRPEEKPFTLAPVVGEYDDPFNQDQGLLRLRLTEDGNALVYGSTGSGKSLLLTTVLCDLLRRHGPEALNVYILDLGEESLQAFAKAPQVGGVLLSGDEERVENLFKMLQEELVRRKRLFADHGGDLQRYCRATGETVPQILVMLHNYSAFSEQFEQLEESLLQLTRDGVRYGISFVMTAASAGAVRYRLMQNFRQTLVLQLNDRTDYVGLLGSTDGVYPSALYGRGIFKTDRAYEFQTARPMEDDSPEALRAFATELAEKSSSRARPIPALPEQVDREFLKGQVSLTEFPVGVEKESLHLRTVDLSKQVVTVLVGQDSDALGSPAQGLAEALTLLPDTAVTVLDGLRVFRPEDGDRYQYVAEPFGPAVDALFQEMVYRNNTYKTALQKGEPLPEYALTVYVITGLSEILEHLSAEGKDRLLTLLEKAEAEYQIRFFVCDTARGIGTMTAGAWYKRFVSGSDGIWAGDGISDQYALRLAKISSGLYADLPAGFGYAVRRGRPTLIKLIARQNGEEAAE